MFQHFGNRLKRDLKQIVDRRLDASVVASGSMLKVRADLSLTACRPLTLKYSPLVSRSTLFRTSNSDMLCGTVAHYWHHWCAPLYPHFVAYLTFPQPEFYSSCHTKAQYDEVGPSICRRYQIFGTAL